MGGLQAVVRPRQSRAGWHKSWSHRALVPMLNTGLTCLPAFDGLASAPHASTGCLKAEHLRLADTVSWCRSSPKQPPTQRARVSWRRIGTADAMRAHPGAPGRALTHDFVSLRHRRGRTNGRASDPAGWPTVICGDESSARAHNAKVMRPRCESEQAAQPGRSASARPPAAATQPARPAHTSAAWRRGRPGRGLLRAASGRARDATLDACCVDCARQMTAALPL